MNKGSSRLYKHLSCPKCNQKLFLIIDMETEVTRVAMMEAEYLPRGGDNDYVPIRDDKRDEWPHAIPMPG
uniref:Uncharacterized protein n=1 Tax=viral metagenome TaxID=1070528 RepID=A0A6M3LLV0_9ZZZZ